MASYIPTNLSAAGLSQFADKVQDESTKEDAKTTRARRANALSSNVDTAKEKVKLNQQAADERLQAAKDKTSGGIIGAIIGAILCVIACIAACTGVGAPLAVALLGLGVACLSAGSTVGGLVGSKCAEDNEENAEKLKSAADSVGIDEKEYDKLQEDLKDQLKATAESRTQLFSDARKRDQERNKQVSG